LYIELQPRKLKNKDVMIVIEIETADVRKKLRTVPAFA
jgi:hypothetical protein